MSTGSERLAMWAAKAALAACLLAGLLFPEIPGVAGKGWPERAVGYPLSALIVPIVWWITRRRRLPDTASTDSASPSTYPYLGDALLVTPFVLDLAGNLMNLYDTFEQFDDILHFVNWTFLVAALVLFLRSARLARWNLVLLGSGFGALAIVAWEGVEWIIQEMGTTGLQLTYDDTIGDLLLSSSGGVVGAALAALALTRRGSSDQLSG
ncbi:MAG TPA: hypothetical protein QF905_05010 [Acidimicrobiales bacterium]|nr:hypothetical protein [Actinomycetota bacterium]MDP7208672.1 hypothetical protein [Acidimicrobiales bacterium]HJL89675.1 hypothetical protein [Acidimicrobiales bacterium]HJO99337.1 hypothetical protein [Acidimicrobiales bacterium]